MSSVIHLASERKDLSLRAQLRASIGLHEAAKIIALFEDAPWYLATAEQKERALQRAELVIMAYAEGSKDTELQAILRGKK